MVASSFSVRTPANNGRGLQEQIVILMELVLINFSTVSGGFAVVQPDSQLSINAVEGYPLEDFSAEAVRNQIAEAQKVVNGGGSEQDVAEAKIELEVRTIRLQDLNSY